LSEFQANVVPRSDIYGLSSSTERALHLLKMIHLQPVMPSTFKQPTSLGSVLNWLNHQKQKQNNSQQTYCSIADVQCTVPAN